MPIQNLVPTIDVGALAQSTVRAAENMSNQLAQERFAQERINIDSQESQSRIQHNSALIQQANAQTQAARDQNELFRQEMPARLQQSQALLVSARLQAELGKAALMPANLEAEKAALNLNIQKTLADLTNATKDSIEKSHVLNAQAQIRDATEQDPLLSDYKNKIRLLEVAKDNNPTRALELVCELNDLRPEVAPLVDKLIQQGDLIDTINKSKNIQSDVGLGLRRSLGSPMDMNAGLLGSRQWTTDPKTGKMIPVGTTETIGDTITGLKNNSLEANKKAYATYLSIRDPAGQKRFVEAIKRLTEKSDFQFDPISHKQRIESIISSKVNDSDLPASFINRFALRKEKGLLVGALVRGTETLIAGVTNSADVEEHLEFNKRLRDLEHLKLGAAIQETENILTELSKSLALKKEPYQKSGLLDQYERALDAHTYLMQIDKTRHQVLVRGTDHELAENGLATGQFNSAAEAIRFVAKSLAAEREAAQPGRAVDWEDPILIDQAVHQAVNKKWIRNIVQE